MQYLQIGCLIKHDELNFASSTLNNKDKKWCEHHFQEKNKNISILSFQEGKIDQERGELLSW